MNLYSQVQQGFGGAGPPRFSFWVVILTCSYNAASFAHFFTPTTDIGNQTARSLNAFRNGKSPTESGFILPDGKGNGSLMRVLPLVLWHNGTDEELVQFAQIQSMVTHGHVCNQVCCALYCLWAKRLIQGNSMEDAYGSSVEKLRQIYENNTQYFSELEWSIRPLDPPEGKGSGYVVDSLRSARMILLKEDSYEKVVKSAIALGDDTDTTAAIAGGLAGIYYGFDNIPQRWFHEMRGKEIARPLLDRFLTRRLEK